ncbi:hypothetical protein D3C75_509750 [compost metagenome]
MDSSRAGISYTILTPPGISVTLATTPPSVVKLVSLGLLLETEKSMYSSISGETRCCFHKPPMVSLAHWPGSGNDLQTVPSRLSSTIKWPVATSSLRRRISVSAICRNAFSSGRTAFTLTVPSEPDTAAAPKEICVWEKFKRDTAQAATKSSSSFMAQLLYFHNVFTGEPPPDTIRARIRPAHWSVRIE